MGVMPRALNVTEHATGPAQQHLQHAVQARWSTGLAGLASKVGSNEDAMSEAIVVLNAGSSSLKFSIYRIDGDDLTRVVRGQVEGVGTKPHFKAKDRKGAVLADVDMDTDGALAGHREAFAHVVQWASERYGDALSPAAVGHRVVHGGLEFAGPTLLTNEVIEKLDQLVPLVPLHQPHNLAAIRAVRSLRPDLPQVASFDTAFHRGRAAVTERFGLPAELYDRGVRRWGFHGLSYASVIDQLHEIAPDIAAGRVIVAHLGSGASMCAMRGGRSVDTTMSFSTLDGLPMGTRCGSLDPGVVLFLLKSRTCQQVEAMLYDESGLLGISGISNDVRELLASKSPRAAEAVEYFVYRAVREIGSLAGATGGIDALVFTAGIGENSPVIRQRICRGLAWLGVALEHSANERGRGCISPAGRSPSTWVIPSDEERVIAAGTWAVVRSAAKAENRQVSGAASSR
jgi:acetate kinase